VSNQSMIVSLALLVACNGEKGGSGDSAGDGLPQYDDRDEDGIIDQHDGADDADEDGSANENDLDSDGDGVTDRIEAGDQDPMTFPIDTDGDGESDFLDQDSDDNCVSDAIERPVAPAEIADSDGDGDPDFRDSDNDADNILDSIEIGASCAIPDKDGDLLPDYMDVDSDNDGIDDLYESGIAVGIGGTPVDTDDDGLADYLDDDSDADGLFDNEEGGTTSGTPPNDTDGDGTYDFQDLDADGDGLGDEAEDVQYHTDPFDADSDGDGFTDGAEIAADTNPLDPTDVIDGLYIVVPERSNVEAKFDFELRIQEGDIAFDIDTTGSMGGTLSAVAGEFNDIVSELADVLPAAKFGVSTHDDYAYGGFGGPPDKPFEMRQQITDDVGLMQDTLLAIPLHGGGDGPESSMEAMYQAASGVGYDQNCNGSYDSSYDVKPFIATADDPFGGGDGQFYDSTDESTGELGGFGFNDYALPIIIEATDNFLRDPENGYGAPGGCPGDAGFSDVVDAVGDLGAYLIQVDVATYGTLGLPQMNDLAEATGSTADTDGDGIANDLLVYAWTGSDDDFRESIVNAISDLLNSITFDKVSLEIDGDTWGFVYAIDPAYYDDFAAEDNGEIVEFTLYFRGMVAATTNDQLFDLKLVVLGDDEIALDKLDIIVVVPGTSY
jgi:hypothetical protein